jgi:hypothetical protein
MVCSSAIFGLACGVAGAAGAGAGEVAAAGDALPLPGAGDVGLDPGLSADGEAGDVARGEAALSTGDGDLGDFGSSAFGLVGEAIVDGGKRSGEMCELIQPLVSLPVVTSPLPRVVRPDRGSADCGTIPD